MANSVLAVDPLWSSGITVQKLEDRYIRIRGHTEQKKTRLLGDAKEQRFYYKAFYRRIDPRLGRTVGQDQAISWLYTMGWKSIEATKFHIAEEAFTRIIGRGALLSPEERAVAHLGRAIATYNRVGCQRLQADLTEADRHPATISEVSFYRGMCLLEINRYDDAEALFEKVIDLGPGPMEGPALYYRALIWELTLEWDKAETGYIDVIENVRDKGLVERAKIRLEGMKKDLRSHLKEKKWWSLLLNTSVGVDSNVLALPAELKASDYGYTEADSGYVQGIVFAEVRPAWGSKFFQQMRYTGFAQHYTGPGMANALDIVSHDVQNAFSLSTGGFDRLGLQTSYNSVSLGKISAHQEYIGITSAKIFLKTIGIFGELRRLKRQPVYEGAEESSQRQLYAKIALLYPKQGYSAPEFNSKATIYTFGYDQNYFESDFMSWGHKAYLESKVAVGRENSYYAAGGGGNYSYLLNWIETGVTWANDFNAQYSTYTSSAADRQDYSLKLNTSLTHEVWTGGELQWLLSGTANLSTQKGVYQYLKYQAQVGITQFF